MEDLDKDIVVFNDEEGNEIELEVVDYFDYENEEYAVMIDPAAVDDDERDLFVFRIQVNGEYEEFLLSLIHIPSPRDMRRSRMPSSA